MGIFQRVKDLFRSTTHKEENPEHILSAFIEASSEKLRELSVAVSRAESVWLTLQEKIELCESNAKVFRKHADEAVRQGNEELAKQWLERAHLELYDSENMKPDASKLKANSIQLKDSFNTLKMKLEEAKEMRNQIVMRNKAALSQLAAHQVFNEDTSSAIDRMKEESFLAEAKAELARTRPF